jgi:hypothetical protein
VRLRSIAIKSTKRSAFACIESSQITVKLDHVYRAEHFLHTKVLVEFILLGFGPKDTTTSTNNERTVLSKDILQLYPYVEEHHRKIIPFQFYRDTYLYVRTRYIERNGNATTTPTASSACSALRTESSLSSRFYYTCTRAKIESRYEYLRSTETIHLLHRYSRRNALITF